MSVGILLSFFKKDTKFSQCVLVCFLSFFLMNNGYANLVGTTPGSFSVDQGIASFSVPIAVPKGIAGMEPAITLDYSSAAGDYGNMAISWSISGLSSIQRCPSNLSQDGKIREVHYDAQDKLCLDGQRLIVVGGSYGGSFTEYRTEIDNFSKIVSYGWSGTGPNWFEVRTKSGQIMRYGATENARIQAQGKSVVKVWALDEIKDTVGNAININYREINSLGDYMPNSISYAGNRINFYYSLGDDGPTGYEAGSFSSSKYRLYAVRSYRGTQLYRLYNIQYENVGKAKRNRVKSVSECFSSTDCYPAVTFGWQGGNEGVFDSKNSLDTSISDNSLIAPVDVSRTKFADFDGDGRTDIYYVDGWGGVKKDTVYLSNGDGTFRIFGGFETGVSADPERAPVDISRINFADFNGDGCSDFYYIPGKTGTHVQDVIHFSKCNGYFGPPVAALKTFVARDAEGAANDIARMNFADFNGDGRSDIYYINSRNGVKTVDTIHLSNGDGSFEEFDGIPHKVDETIKGASVDISRLKFADFNGDGRTDIYRVNGWASRTRDEIFLSNGEGFDHPPIQGLNTYVGSNTRLAAIDISRLKFGDFNGDGKTDIYYVTGWSSAAAWDTLYLSKGNGGFKPLTGLLTKVSPSEKSAPISISRVLVSDFNGDGKADIYYINGYGGGAQRDTIHLSRGDGIFNTANGLDTSIHMSNLGAALDISRIQLADFNGDGMLDIFQRNGSGGTQADTLWLNQDKQHRITRFTNGLGVSNRVTYAPLAFGSNVYVKDRNANYPMVDIAGAQHVVTSETVNNNEGGYNKVTYRYGGAKVHALGRGHQGFRWVQSTNSATNRFMHMERVNAYDDPYFPGESSHSFPFHSSYIYTEERVLLSNGERPLVSQAGTLSSYASHKPGIYASQIDRSVEIAYDDDGETMLTRTDTYNRFIDEFGNIGQIEIFTQGGDKYFSKIVNNQYSNDIGRWHLGRLTRAEVKHYDEHRSLKTNVSEFAYHPYTGLLVKEVVEPNTPLALTKTYLHDNFGNIIETTITGATEADGSNVQSRTTKTQYTPDHRYVLRTENSLGHKESYTYDDRCGLVKTLTGPNNIKTTWEYDFITCEKIKELRADGTSTQWSKAWLTSTSKSWFSSRTRTIGYTITTTTSGQSPVTVYFDNFGNAKREVRTGYNGRLVYQDKIYDSINRVTQESLPYYSGETVFWVRHVYDDFGRISQTTSPGPNNSTVTTRFEFNGFDNVEINAKGFRKTTHKNAIGQIERVSEEEGAWVMYDYDPVGNLKYTNANGVISTLTYDRYGNKLSMQDANMGLWKYGYNAFGELKWQADAKGQVSRMDYDALGRITKRTEYEGTTTWFYDSGYKAIGKLSAVQAPGGYREVHSYDHLGRPKQVQTFAENTAFTTKMSYDYLGRISNKTQPDGINIRYDYDAQGYLTTVKAAGVAVWSSLERDAADRLTSERFNNGVQSQYHYTQGSGLLSGITTTKGTTRIRDLRYAYDENFNVTSRIDGVQDMTEAFAYDRLDRLVLTNVSGSVSGTPYNHEVSYQYDARGNITYKSDVGAYKYNTIEGAGALAGPHAVLQASATSDYRYDKNGNLVAGGGREIQWTSFNKPSRFTYSGTDSAAFVYGPDRARYLKVFDGNKRTVYIGKSYERETIGREVKHKHFIYAEGHVVATYVRKTVSDQLQADDFHYFHRDNLGSVDTITNELGIVAERLSYDAFGKRRYGNWSSPRTPTDLSAKLTNRGYTGHEHIDEVGLIHMNGRVYDPLLGRFLSADPHIQSPFMSQNHNRYSYVLNNPLKYTDPSGYLFKKLKKAITKAHSDWTRVSGTDAIKKYIKNNAWAQTAVQIGAAVLVPGWGMVITSAALTRLNGGSWSDTFRAAAVTGITSLAFGGLHDVPGGSWTGSLTELGHAAAKTVMHGTVGGVTSQLGGGDFKSGFMSSAFTQAVSISKGLDRFGTNPESLPDRARNAVVAAVIGGTASVVGGGKFRNGALTGAYSRLLNELSQGNVEEIQDRVEKEHGFRPTPEQVQDGTMCNNDLCYYAERFISSLKSDGTIELGAPKAKLKLRPFIQSEGSDPMRARVGVKFNAGGIVKGSISGSVNAAKTVDVITGGGVSNIKRYQDKLYEY